MQKFKCSYMSYKEESVFTVVNMTCVSTPALRFALSSPRPDSRENKLCCHQSLVVVLDNKFLRRKLLINEVRFI